MPDVVAIDAPPQFTADELRRVGIAATLAVVSYYIIILVEFPMVGYSGLAQSGPRAAVHGAAIALLMGNRGRWRCLALLGVVLGLFVGFIQPGIAPLAIVFSLAGILAACTGRAAGLASRAVAIVLAAVIFELLGSAATPLRILYSTRDGHEPVLWMMYGAEIPLRIVGAIIGVLLARRSTRRSRSEQRPIRLRAARATKSRTRGSRPIRPPRAVTVIVILAAMLACTAPMTIGSIKVLSIIAGVYVALALLLGVRRGILVVGFGLLWCWLIYGSASYLWHHDLSRAIDLGRTFVLRFIPMSISAVMIIKVLRGADVLRMFRYLRISPVILLPLASILRELRTMGLELRRSRERIRRVRAVCGRTWWIRHPRLLFAALPSRSFHGWIEQLAE